MRSAGHGRSRALCFVLGIRCPLAAHWRQRQRPLSAFSVATTLASLEFRCPHPCGIHQLVAELPVGQAVGPISSARSSLTPKLRTRTSCRTTWIFSTASCVVPLLGLVKSVLPAVTCTGTKGLGRPSTHKQLIHPHSQQSASQPLAIEVEEFRLQDHRSPGQGWQPAGGWR